MIRNYIKIAFRSFKRHSTFTFINLAGLTLGLVVSLLILLWVQDELGINRFHKEGDRIHQIVNNLKANKDIFTWTSSPLPYAETLEREIPEIESTTAVLDWDALFEVELTKNKESGYLASPNFFNFFTFPLIKGDPNQVFSKPNAIAISEDLAAKYFGPNWQNQELLGQSIRLNYEQEAQVSAIFKNPPTNSTLDFDFVLSTEDYIKQEDYSYFNTWGNFFFDIYTRIPSTVRPEQLTTKLTRTVNDHREEGSIETVFLQPFEDKYLYSQFENGQIVGGRIEYVRIFFIAALFILIIACINYMNLATARSSRRAKEVGIRKVVGANRRSIASQFLSESGVLTLIALVLALCAAQLLMPYFNDLTGKQLALSFTNPYFWFILTGTGLTCALLAGTYPALMLSSFRIVQVLKGKLTSTMGNPILRRGLVVLQFVLSALLIVGALGIKKQINFIQNKNLGLNKNNVLLFPLESELREKLEFVTSELKNDPAIQTITLTSENPLSVGGSTGDPQWEGMQEDQGTIFHILTTDHNFISSMDVSLLQGENFREGMPTDTANFNYIINQEAAKAMGFDNPVGKRLAFWGYQGRIVGVVEDFHFASLHETIKPLILRYEPSSTGAVLIRPEAGKEQEAIAKIKAIQSNLAPNKSANYRFLDASFASMYRSELLIAKLANLFAAIAIFISCLGLLGLAAFTTERRTKEIGIRKVLGASVGDILILINKEFALLLVVAIVIAFPIASYFVNNWLQEFAYRTTLGIDIFLWAAGSLLLIAFLTISFHAIRAAWSNPVDSIRYE